MNTQEMFRNYHKMTRNFMTPKILKFQAVANKIIELSSGFGFDNSPIWGVSEFIYDMGTQTGFSSTGNGQMFTNPKQARLYYKTLITNQND